ncbi:MAG: uroporphyrinogen-III C-methyltransferase [Desulfovibrio sp.]|nr:uroporphyrinogen-III C-methyltransferase [Desulfovibrio sp.]
MKVYLLGAGPGDPELLTLKAQRIIASADVIVYDALANKELLRIAKKDAEIIYVGKVAGNHALPQPEINALLIRKAEERKTVARLKGGDPYIFGRGGEEAEALVQAGIPFEEVPGITSTIAAPAYAGIPLTHRDLVSSVTIVTGHEKEDKADSRLNWQALAQSGSTLVFVMGMRNLPFIAKNLIANGLSEKTPAALIYRGTTPMQRSLVADLGTLPEKARENGFTNPSVIVVGQVVALNDTLNWFEKKPLLGKSIVVTRAREQASQLVTKLTELGAEVLEYPTIRIAPLSSYSELDSAIKDRARYTAVIFTSQNGVRFFWERLRVLGLDARAFGSLRVCAIGPMTAKALSDHGIHADLVPERFVAESLVSAFLEHFGSNKGSILIPRAKEARDVLPDGLRKAGFDVHVVPTYETLPDEGGREDCLERLTNDTLSCTTFASSSTVTNFLRTIPKELVKKSSVRLAAIGPITAKTLENEGLTAHITANPYTIDALIEAVTTAFRNV